MKFGFGTIVWRLHSIGFILRQEFDRKITIKNINTIWSGWAGLSEGCEPLEKGVKKSFVFKDPYQGACL
jgi:hypothetical protein